MDIVERLKVAADRYERNKPRQRDLAAFFRDAADEIERLRAALRPFALMADRLDEWQKGTNPQVDFSFDADSLRDARRVLKSSTYQ